MKWTKFASLVPLMFALAAGSALAASSDAVGAGQQTESGKMLHKLGRGVGNVVTCWLEVPHQIAVEWQETDPFTGLFVGTVKGVGWGFARFTTGVFDTVTFAYPIPPDYRPILEPEFVYTEVGRAPIPEQSDVGGNMTNKTDGCRTKRIMTTGDEKTR